MANVIYTKTTDIGDDNCLILDVKNSYKRQFPMGDDWTQIHVGFFYSFTTSVNSVTGNNEYDDSLLPFNSGQTTADTFMYLGVSRYAAPDNFLPGSNYTGGADPNLISTGNADQSFAGVRYSKLTYKSDIGGNKYGSVLGGDGHGWNVGVNQDNTAWGITGDYDSVSEVINTAYKPTLGVEYASYIGFDIWKTTLNGLPKLYIRQYANNVDGPPADEIPVSDVSADTLKQRIDDSLKVNLLTGDTRANVILDYSGNSPDSFFFYNGFGDTRLRIHSMGVKKVS